MIVKDEAPVIRRCLDSVRPLVSSWCILDTGSTDGTQDLVREHLRHLPGALHQSDWKGFGPSRTEAIQLARAQADYLLFMDADDQMVLPEGYRLPELVGDCYFIEHRMDTLRFMRRDLVATRLDWRYVGLIHEFIHCEAPHRTLQLPGPWVLERHEGARSRDPRKYQKDAELLERSLREDPANARDAFYLAQSYRDAGQAAKAVTAYRRRAAMGGWEEEVYLSLLQAARLLERLGRPEAEVVPAYLEACGYRPQRAEALGDLARFLRVHGEFRLAARFAQAGMALPVPDDILFLEPAYHTWRCLDEFALSAFRAGRYREALAACDRLLAEPHLPEDQVPRVEGNRRQIREALNQARGCDGTANPAGQTSGRAHILSGYN